MNKYPCVGEPLVYTDIKVTLYIPHIWVNARDGIYGRTAYSTAKEAKKAAQAAVDKMIKEQVKK